ncbi:MAG: TIGR02206 family membrane protein [Defluviitaleaceae bacterium]|nr:TIGR02206 family membrane protein [Defluviitaleaceae bacterium]
MIQRYGFFAYFSDRPEAELGFGLYSVTHFVVLAIIAVFAWVVCIVYRRMDDINRLKMVRVIAVSVLVLEFAQQISYPIFHDGVRVEYLPFQLCGIMIFLGIVYAIKPNDTLGEIFYGLGLPGYVAALLFPNWDMYPIINFYAIKSFSTHALQIAFVLMLLAAGQIRPKARNAWKPMVFIALLAVPTYIFNIIFGTNFLFINAGSPGSPLEFLVDTFGNPLFLIPYAMLAAAVISLMYVPWFIIERRKRKREDCGL